MPDGKGKKHVMGASVQEYPEDALPSTKHSYSRTDGRRFQVRGAGYEKTGVKVQSDSVMAEIIAVDLFKTDHKLCHIMKYIEIPEEYRIPHPLSDSKNFIPQLFVINFMIPAYSPSNPIWGTSKTDGKSYSAVLYIRLKPETIDLMKDDSSNAAKLLNRFFQMDCTSEEDFALRGRLKGIPILLNPQCIGLGVALRQLIKKFDAKPFLTGPKYHSFIKTDHYLECDIDIHQWIYIARKTLHSLIGEIHKMDLDFGVVVEAADEEAPERMLASIRVSQIDPEQAVHISVGGHHPCNK
uniref:Protein ENHANCED DISEASE RESISTANCE 2 C-terminal domain-containing protein n=1 Tax=Spongospora subterranea TaxID=70186 RepID=A0A0H5R9Y0_9EUKA|eukprot:CRZ10606.1 hypothetical protein [Spongospora subterranea]